MKTLKSVEWKTVGTFSDVLAVKVTTADGRRYVANLMKYNGEFYYDLINDWCETVDKNCAKSALQLLEILACVWDCKLEDLVAVALAAEQVCKD